MDKTPESVDDVEQEYETFWKPIVERGGKLDLDQVKKELYDFSMLMQNATKVYDHVTGGRISKLNTNASSIIAEADDHYSSLYQE